MIPWIISAVAAVIATALAVKLIFLRRSIREAERGFEEKCSDDTNTLIDTSSNDKALRSLTAALNRELAGVRKKRQKYSEGDMEIKKAVTNISHDLRTPLTAISGYLDLLEREEKSEKAEEYLGVIRNRTESMKSLAEELFRFSVVNSSEAPLLLKEENICDILRESLAEGYTLLTEAGITPKISIPEKIIRTVDKTALMRVYGNIISNAAKYSDGDLTVTVSENGTVSFSNSAMSLSNVGVGRLFDRFFTVNEARKSTGLGLSIAKTLIEQMNGEIFADYSAPTLTVSVVLKQTDNRLC